MAAMILSSNATTLLPPPNLSEIKTGITIKDLRQFHAKYIKTGQIHDPIISAEVLRSCLFSQHRDVQYARLVFDQMPEPNRFSWNTLIRAFAESDDPSQALTIFCQMLCNDNVEPNRYTFPSVLKACARASSFQQGLQIHGQVIKRGLSSDAFVLSNLIRTYVLHGAMDDAHGVFNKSVELDGVRNVSFEGDVKKQEGYVVLWNVMIDGYLRLGEMGLARQLFDEMPQRSVVSWNGMVAGYAQNGFFQEALETFHEMQMSNVCPNYVTLVSVLPAISHLGAIGLGKWIHTYVLKREIEVNDELGSALIHMYSKCGCISLALQVFEGLSWRNVITWNAIIGGLAMHGRAKDAVDHFLKMEQAGVKPSGVTFIGLLSACSHGGLVDEGRYFFNKMIRVYGLRHRIEHYGCMVDLFGRAGLLEEAEQLVLNMPMQPDDVIWKALLGACKIHGNVEMGERVAKRLIELAPHDSGCYVTVSNMYSSLRNWDAVAKVRLKMKEMDITKDPGCSLIEIDGVIHEFLVEDDSHPRTEEIQSMLEEMVCRLRLEGYMPDTTQVLLNIDEEERESTLHYHSEKIAIAFGLISTSRNTTLQVVKNLRMCADCHASIKFVSKLYARKIVVRDRNRFHHFEDGFCSCGDYW